MIMKISMKKNRVLSFVLAFLLGVTTFVAMPLTAFGADAHFPSGNGAGTQENPYQITTAAELADLAQLVNTNSYESYSYRGSSYKLMNDIDLSAYGAGSGFNDGKGWIPIGVYINSSYHFAGNFDGNGKIISGLYVNDGVSTHAVGLFGRSARAVIKNLGVVGADLNAAEYAGGIAAFAHGTIENCFVTGSIIGTSSNSCIGGIAGYIDSGSIVKNCYAACSVTSAHWGGGIVGVSSGTVQDCVALNPIVAGTAYNAITGRIISQSGGTLSGNHAFGDMVITKDGQPKSPLTEGANQVDGLAKSQSQLQVSAGFPAAFGQSPWTYEIGKLPGLGGAPREMPLHLGGTLIYRTSVRPESIDFAALPFAYGAQATREIVIRNSGNTALRDVRAVLSDTTAFEITPALGSSTNIPADSALAVNVRPKEGLDIGDYSATLTITARDAGDDVRVTKSVPLAFKVEVNPSVTHELAFDANGGQVNPDSQTVIYGLTYGTLPVPTRTGHTFDGWFTAERGGTEVSATTAVTGDATCYAHWTVNNYTVTFNANGGTGGTPSVTKEYNTAIGTLPVLTRTGYTFEGWFTEASGGVLVTPVTVVIGDVTYYARWKPVQSGANPGDGDGGVKPGDGGDGDGKQTSEPPAGTDAGKVVLPKTKITKVAVGKRLAKISFKKVAKANKVTKYQLQYRMKDAKKWTAKNFTVKYTGKATAKITVKKLNKGKRYQFRIRAWKTVDAKKYCAPWSTAKLGGKVK